MQYTANPTIVPIIMIPPILAPAIIIVFVLSFGVSYYVKSVELLSV